ncbi:hypothetical protein FOZ60_010394 [Perkinsus olseni]|uniref:MULE transposase domain-containing protein n=1 Tax=Perkinsus olseni TaxID=32597 RepID=A0A7J6NGI8_PEROL|nr:hypothetical protein FOZ60_010394 [Perkinsus olseni]
MFPEPPSKRPRISGSPVSPSFKTPPTTQDYDADDSHSEEESVDNESHIDSSIPETSDSSDESSDEDPGSDQESAASYGEPQWSWQRSKRGKPLLVVSSYRLHRKRPTTKDGCRVRYVCSVKECNASIYTLYDAPLFDTLKDHNHAPPLSDNGWGAFLATRVKEIATEQPELENREIYERALDDVDPDYLEEVEGQESFRHVIQRARSKALPPNPKTRADIDLPRLSTCRGESFILIDDAPKGCREDRLIVLGSVSSLKLFCDADVVYGDGTFRSAPARNGLYKQIYTFFVKDKAASFSIPVLHAFLPDKSYTSYHRFLFLLRQRIATLGYHFKPTVAIFDFESSMLKAWKLLFQSTLVRCCFFHLKKNIHSYLVERCGLKQHHARNTNGLRDLLNSMRGLPLVPIHHIPKAWAAIEIEYQTVRAAMKDNYKPGLDRFIAYFRKTYLGVV